MALRRKGFRSKTDGEDAAASSGGTVDRLLAQEALDDEEQELLMAGLETIHNQQKSRNAIVLITMTTISALVFFVIIVYELLRKGRGLQGLSAPLSSLVGHLPFLANQLKLRPRHRFRNAQKHLDRLGIDMRYMVLWHSIPLVARFLQREPWQSLLLWFVPPALAMCTILAGNDARDLDFGMAALTSQKYELKGA